MEDKTANALNKVLAANVTAGEGCILAWKNAVAQKKCESTWSSRKVLNFLQERM